MRTGNWPTKLALFIEEKRHQPFNWQDNNCGFFACDWIAMLVGKDPAAPYRKKTSRALVRLVNQLTVEEIAVELATANAWPEIPVLAAQRGDVVSGDSPNGPALGVCVGRLVAFAGKVGLIFKPVAECRKAWRIN